MEFITTGNRIAVENFSIGKVYTIVWATGNYKSLACVGKGSDFVMFQDQAPDLLFCLTMDTAIAVESIDEGGGGAGTMNYNELENKPSINGIVLVGNKTGADLNLVSQADLDDYATNASVVAGLATKQDALSSSQLAAVNSGITSELVTQIGTNTSAIAGKQDALSSSQLAAVNSGIDSTKVAQIEINKNNILSIYNTGYAQKNLLDSKAVSTVKNGITFTVNADKSITISGTNSVNDTTNLPITNGYVSNVWVGKKISGCTNGSNTTYALACMYSNDGVSYIKTVYQTDGDYTIENFNYIYIIITIYNNYAITDTQTIYPMIRDIGDDTYQAYSMSNAELTAAIQALQAQLANQ